MPQRADLRRATSSCGLRRNRIAALPGRMRFSASTLFPAAPDGLVGDLRVVRGHLGGGVVEQDPDDFLRDVAVDEPAGEGVPPLVGCQVHRAAVLVADVAGVQPPVQHAAVAVVGDRVLAAALALSAGNRCGCRSGQRSATRCCWARIPAWSSSSMGTAASRRILWLK